MPASPTTDPARALRQAAQTARYLGVDFLPVRAAVRDHSVPVTPVAAANAATVEPKLAPVRPTPAAPASHAHAASSAPSVAALARPVSPLPRPDFSSDPDRAEAQRLLDLLRARYEKDAPHQHFITDHHSIVFGEGDPRARLMFIGEAPGAEEDKTGRPFVGRAGVLLDKMITAMGLKRELVYIANVLKTRPPNNATPTLDEAARCAPYLHEQILIIRPAAIVTLGLPASRCILNSAETMTRLRGHWSFFTFPLSFSPFVAPKPLLNELECGVPVMPTFHPAFLLRQYTAENRQKVWSDLKQVVEKLGITSSATSP